MAGLQWGAALGAGAKAALSTYETLEDIDQKRADSARQDRALELREAANSRAAATHSRTEQDAARLRDIYAGGSAEGGLRLPDGTGGAASAGAETNSRLRQQPTEATPPVAPNTAAGGDQLAQPAVAPTNNTQQRGAGSHGDLQERLLRGGFVKEAAQVGQLRNQDLERQLLHVRTTNELTKLKGTEIDLAHKQLGTHIARAGQILEQMPGNDNVPLTNAPDGPARAVVDQMVAGYDLTPDGRKMTATYNDDGSIELQFVDRKTGNVTGGQKITTQGQLRQLVRMSSAFSDPVTYNQYITRAETSRRERELHELTVAEKKTSTALDQEKLRSAQAESGTIARFNELLKDPAKNEEQLRHLADQMAVFNPKLIDTRKVTNPDGTESEISYNKMAERIDAMVPLDTIQTPNSKGEPATYTAQQAAQQYTAALPKALQATGGNANMVLAQLRAEHDKKFRRGSFDRYVMPVLKPRIQALMQQAQKAQQDVQSGAQEGMRTQPENKTGPSSALSQPGWKMLRDAATASRDADQANEPGIAKPGWKFVRDAIAQ